MKSLILLTSLLLLTRIILAQGLVYQKTIDGSHSQSVQDIHLINDDTYAIITHIIANTGPVTYIQKLDPIGDVIWSKSLPYTLNSPKMIHTSDNKLLVYASGITGCDVGSFILYLEKIDLQGNTTWSNPYEMPVFGQVYELIVSELNSGKILMAAPTFFPVGTEYIYEINSQGNIFDSIPFFGPHPNMFSSLDNETFVSIASNQIIKYDTTGMRLDSITLGLTPIATATGATTTLYVSTENLIKIYDFNLTESTPISIPNVTFLNGLKVQGGKLSSLAKINQDLSIINFDNTLNIESTYSYLDPSINYNLGDFENSRLITSKNIFYNSRNFQGIHLAKYDTISNFTNASSMDISITDVIIDDYILNYVASPNVFNINPEVSVEITNTSQETLHTVMVNAFRSSSMACGENVKRVFLDTLNIPAGGTKKVSIGFIGNGQNASYNNDIYENLCVYLTTPNDFPDFDISNNELCESYSAGTVGITSNTSSDFEVFPNPVSETLNLRVSGDYTFATIINSLGMEVMKLQIGNQQLHNLDVSSLINGLYIVKLTDKNEEVLTRKFIKN